MTNVTNVTNLSNMTNVTPWDPLGLTFDPLGPCRPTLDPGDPVGLPLDPLIPCRPTPQKGNFRVQAMFLSDPYRGSDQQFVVGTVRSEFIDEL